MLKRMVLILTEAYKKQLEVSVGYPIFIEEMHLHGTIVELWECEQWKKEALPKDSIREEMQTAFTIYLSDDESILSCLQDKGRYTIAVYHSEVKGILSGTQYAIEGIEDVEWDFYNKVYQRFTGEPWKITETERCIIREMGPEDVDDLYELYSSPLVTRYTEPLFLQKEQELQYIQDYVEKIYKYYGFGIWLIHRKEDGKLIGRAGFSYRPGFEEVELGFVIGEAYWNKGYAYEVCCHLMELGKSVYRFEKVQALVRKENEASIGLLKKLGFAYAEDVMLDGQEYGRYLS